MVLRFAIFFSTIAGILCYTTYRLLKKRLVLSEKHALFLALILGAIFILLVAAPVYYRAVKPNPGHSVSYAFQFAQYFLMGYLGVTFIVFTLAEFIQTLFTSFDPQKRIFLTEGTSRALFAGVSVSVFGGLGQALAGPQVKPVQISLKQLPDSFHGLKIVQLSDVHIGPLLRKNFLDDVVAKVNSLKPDLIFITGDLVDGTVDQLREHIAPLAQLQASHGVFFCTGNHEYYSGAEEWIAHLRTLNVKTLENANEVITRKHETGELHKILVAGVYDHKATQILAHHQPDPVKAATTSEEVAVKLLLAHNPHSAPANAQAGFDVIFSGHTHAGQFYPFTWIAGLVYKHFEGLSFVTESTQIYVNRGTGYWGPPNRLGKSSEITEITLVKG